MEVVLENGEARYPLPILGCHIQWNPEFYPQWFSAECLIVQQVSVFLPIMIADIFHRLHAEQIRWDGISGWSSCRNSMKWFGLSANALMFWLRTLSKWWVDWALYAGPKVWEFAVQNRSILPWNPWSINWRITIVPENPPPMTAIFLGIKKLPEIEQPPLFITKWLLLF